MRVLAWFQLVVGGGIVGLWPLLILAGEVPELAAGQRDIWFHIAAEVIAGLLLITAGIGLLRGGGDRTRLLAAFALGALLYTGINSAGYYADLGRWVPTLLLVSVGVAAGGALTVLVRGGTSPDRPPTSSWRDSSGADRSPAET